MKISRRLQSFGAVVLVLSAIAAHRSVSAQTAAADTEVLRVSLNPLIDVAATHRNRFAVDIPHVVDASRVGTWSISRGIAIWRYSVRIPTAVSMSFHSTNMLLPASAQLRVNGGGAAYTYRAGDIKNGQLWSRISKGDTLDFELTVAPGDRRNVVLQISSLQAGYRGFGPAVTDHPHYAELKAQTRAASTSSCIVNYECDATTANTPAGQASVALIVANVDQCSGTLINDVPQDGKPYVLTARHCEADSLGGGDPGAAANVTVYWDATSACGSPLGTLYDPGIPSRQGAVSEVEQQDAWLLLLSGDPVVNDAYFAGFDATGGAVQGGYTVHYALSNDRQITDWNGQAAAAVVPPHTTLAVGYTSNFWDVVNLTGTIGPGASGSALIDQNQHVVGSLSVGNPIGETADGYLQCPASPPPTPTTQNALAAFTSLAAVWNSTADITGTATTIQQILDPNNTGTLVVNSIPAPQYPQFTTPQVTVSDNVSATLTWSAAGASSCTASGGQSGDGWSGALAVSGNQGVRETTTGAVTYGISCMYPTGRTAYSQLTISWVAPDPVAVLIGTRAAWAGGSFVLTWSTNDPPCQLTGGSAGQTLTGANGTITVTENTAGNYDYHLTCGSGSQAASDALVSVVAPSVTLVPNTTDLLLGQALELRWTSVANSCTTIGGAANDNWSGSQVSGSGFVSFWPSTVGTYTYTINCVNGKASAQASTVVTVENNAPYATLTASANEIGTGQTVTLTYQSNIAGCVLGMGSAGAQTLAQFSEDTHTGADSQGTTTYTGQGAGAAQFTFTCGAQGSTPAVVSATPLTVTVVAGVTASVSAPATAVTGTPFTLTWQTSNASSCTASGGGADGNSWQGTVAVPSGQQTITPTVAGTFTYTLNCVGLVSTDTQTAQASISVTASSSSSSGGSGTTSGGGGKGGGGAIDDVSLGLVALSAMLASSRRLSKKRETSLTRTSSD